MMHNTYLKHNATVPFLNIKRSAKNIQLLARTENRTNYPRKVSGDIATTCVYEYIFDIYKF